MAGSTGATDLGVTVVIPVRDGAEVLRRCLSALGAQTLLPEEVIVVDDGSRDDSAAVAAAWGARVVSIDAASIPAASAAGYDEARSAIIARLDADSVPPPDWLASVAGGFRRNPELAALTGPGVFSRGPLRGMQSALYLGAYRLLAGLALGHPPLFGSNLALRREEWQRVRGEVHRDDPMVHDDFDLAFHVGAGIRWDRALRVAIDPPSLAPESVRVRIRRGFRTVFIHWPDQAPWNRRRPLSHRITKAIRSMVTRKPLA